MAETTGQSCRQERERMMADAILPDDIQPTWGSRDESPQTALITGACGFLGRYVARELLNQTNLHIICLVRDKPDEKAANRVARTFMDIGISPDVIDTRVEVLTGDITEADFGLDSGIYAELAQQVDVIYHCAAQVDWVRSYGLLYKRNVGGVLAMLRLACEGPVKRLIFVSSVAVCYASDGPDHIDEETDMLPFIEGMPLGYARSKCVAETLLRQASDRGVPVTVLRPALIAGESATGKSSPTDFIAALLQGCINTGMAIDTDWLLDCVPVDFVARVMAQVPQGDTSWQVLHLMHQRPRYWRELILWINLHGYPIALVDDDTWIRHLFDEQHARGTMLYAQRQFFCGKSQKKEGAPQSRPYETYLASGQARIDTRRTRGLLAKMGLHEAALDADLLHAYFDDYRNNGVLPQREGINETPLTLNALMSGKWSIRGETDMVRWAAAEQKRIGTDDGLLSEIASARIGESIGLRYLHFRRGDDSGTGGPSSAVLKAKVSDTLLQALTIDMARVCKPELGQLFRQYSDALGLGMSHERELALYEMAEPRLRRHMPDCYGTLRDSAHGHWALLIEHLPEAEQNKGQPHLKADEPKMTAILNGLAEIHAVWYGRSEDLVKKPWLADMPDPVSMSAMLPLWQELASYATPWFETWCGQEISAVQSEILSNLDHWWPRLHELPTTLIHNDFNPRNLLLRNTDGQQRLCVYDWELATRGVPQHDLAELLCFTWHDEMRSEDLDRILETYRSALSSSSGKTIDKKEWREGFDLSLQHLLINRLALYTLMHRFRPLHYLPRVMHNWMRLHLNNTLIFDNTNNEIVIYP